VRARFRETPQVLVQRAHLNRRRGLRTLVGAAFEPDEHARAPLDLPRVAPGGDC